MKTLILAAAVAALTASSAAYADTVVTKETEAGVYSAPTAGATPQARRNPAPDTTVLEKRTKTTVHEEPSTTVIERRSVEPDADVETRTRLRTPD